MSVKILIADREYSDYKFVNIDTEELVEKNNIDIFGKKILNNDVLSIDGDEISVVQSQIRNAEKLAGVLVVENNITYGRSKNGKLFYRVIPDDTHLPYFLVPYELKVGFNKKYVNKYVTFKFKEWSNKHPTGLLQDTLGDVNILEVFYEYQLYCKSLHISMTNFVNKTRSTLNKQTKEQYIDNILYNNDYHIIDRRYEYIFSIDSRSTTDFDDALSIEKIDNNWKVSIYISNVFLWLETLKLWDSFAQRVSTIYLPDRKRPMLPTILSDTLCSLQEGQLRFALCLDIYIDENGKFINSEDYSFKNCIINVTRNYSHGEKYLHSDINYQELMKITKLLDKSVKSSQDLVSYWMVVMNMYTASVMNEKKVGIFRTAFIKNKELLNSVPTNLSQDSLLAIKLWNNSMGKYVCYEEGLSLEHELLKNKLFHTTNMNSYLQITSPIRRLTDLLNQIILFKECNIIKTVTDDANIFLDKWRKRLEYINTSMRSIRKIQVDCNLLSTFYNNNNLLDETYQGVMFDKLQRTDGMYCYMVYLERFKLFSRVSTTSKIDNYTMHNFKIYLFEDEDKVKKKVRLQILN